jgi:hypothetical protein
MHTVHARYFDYSAVAKKARLSTEQIAHLDPSQIERGGGMEGRLEVTGRERAGENLAPRGRGGVNPIW